MAWTGYRDILVRIAMAAVVGWAFIALLTYYVYGFGRGDMASTFGWIVIRAVALAAAISVAVVSGWRGVVKRGLCVVGSLILAAPLLMLPLLIRLIWSGLDDLGAQAAVEGHTMAFTVGQVLALGISLLQVTVFAGVIGTFTIAIGIWIGRDPS